MSMERQETGPCPNCGKEITVTVWQSLNTALDPDAARDLRQGKLMHPVCPHCKAQLSTEQQMLYHDEEHSVMVWFVPGATREELAHCAQQGMPKGAIFAPLLATYRVEAVATYPELVECARILHAGLDERAVAVMKAVLLAQYSEENSGRAAMGTYLQVDEATGEKGFFLRDDDDVYRAPFDEALYAACQEVVGDEKPAVADVGWAAELLKRRGAES